MDLTTAIITGGHRLQNQQIRKIQESLMKAVYDPKTDTLTMEFKPGPVAESDEQKPGVILDYDIDGNLVGLEVLDASKRITEARTMNFQVAG